MIESKIIKDSISYNGIRLTTMQIKFHRFILPEFNTHRMFSRNFQSSRAIPTEKLIEQVRNNPAMPVFLGKNQPGMQSKEELDDASKNAAIHDWKLSANYAANIAHSMLFNGLHKQTVNRVLEPYLYITGIVTATEWDNFFELRCHSDAQPEMQELAFCMKKAINGSTPKSIAFGQWHLPYITNEDYQHSLTDLDLAKISAARCARVSYLNHDGSKPDIKKDLQLFERLAGSTPIHASPLEHQATPLTDDKFCKNFNGWQQYRDVFEHHKFLTRK